MQLTHLALLQNKTLYLEILLEPLSLVPPIVILKKVIQIRARRSPTCSCPARKVERNLADVIRSIQGLLPGAERSNTIAVVHGNTIAGMRRAFIAARGGQGGGCRWGDAGARAWYGERVCRWVATDVDGRGKSGGTRGVVASREITGRAVSLVV